MTAKEMREYAKEQAKTLNDQCQKEYDSIIICIKQHLDNHPSSDSMEVYGPMHEKVKAILDRDGYRVSYIPAVNQLDESSHKISWAL